MRIGLMIAHALLSLLGGDAVAIFIDSRFTDTLTLARSSACGKRRYHLPV